jgi:hypothetical protein
VKLRKSHRGKLGPSIAQKSKFYNPYCANNLRLFTGICGAFRVISSSQGNWLRLSTAADPVSDTNRGRAVKILVFTEKIPLSHLPVVDTKGNLTTVVHDGAQVVAEYTAPIFQSQDIGSPTLAGSFSDNGAGTLTLAGAGADIWGTSDQFRFAYRSLTGDGTITALVSAQGNTNAWAKAGVMIRGTLDPAAANAAMLVTPGNGESFQRRTAAGGASTDTATGTGTGAAPYWVRLVRAGATITGYCSRWATRSMGLKGSRTVISGKCWASSYGGRSTQKNSYPHVSAGASFSCEITA